ncbi:MAG: HEAT repeat domain-containing protein [Nannocystaceae bacterium]
MRTLVISSLLALSLAMGACQKSDPNAFETHIAAIKDPGARPAGFSGLEALVKAITSAPGDNSARIQEFVDKVIPEFEALWDEVPEYRDQILTMLYQIGRPEGANLWNKALVFDGSDASRKLVLAAVDGIAKAKATATVDTLIAQLDALLQAPSKDKGPEGGELRIAMVKALGELRDKKAVPVLIKVMEQTKENQPVAVHREAAKALGNIRDASAVDALLTVAFRVPDSPSTTDIGNRSKLALVTIGPPAVEGVRKMLAGQQEEVNKLAASNGVDLLVVQQTAVGILGAMGAKEAVDDLLAFMPRDGCGVPAAPEPKKTKKGKKKEEEQEIDPASASLRAFVGNSLGLIGDEKAAEPLCQCVNATHNPGDMFPITEALGRIGGDVALNCLIDEVKNGEYDPEALDNSDFSKQIRWEAARFAVLVAGPDKIGEVKAAIEGNADEKVKKEMEPWMVGITLVETCKDDKECYVKTLKDQNAEWFAREKAAYELVRIAKGDKAVALEMSKAFKVRNADARVSMALLVPRILDGAKCNECADAFEAVMSGEKGTMDATMQLPVLTARMTIARISE